MYLLAVNGAAETVDATLTVQGGFKTVATEFGKAPAKTDDGRLAVSLAPLEPLLVRLMVAE